MQSTLAACVGIVLEDEKLGAGDHEYSLIKRGKTSKQGGRKGPCHGSGKLLAEYVGLPRHALAPEPTSYVSFQRLD